jgi:hypothetical protein
MPFRIWRPDDNVSIGEDWPYSEGHLNAAVERITPLSSGTFATLGRACSGYDAKEKPPVKTLRRRGG